MIRDSKIQLSWAIIGGGNGGQSLAGHLGLMGFPVKIYDIFPKTIDAIQAQGGIHVTGEVEGFGPVELATTDIAEAIHGADLVMIVAPAVAHCEIAKTCAPWLDEGQVVFIHPGATGGALEFWNVLQKHGCQRDLVVGESNSLIYACRSPKPGYATIFGIKRELMAAALPSKETDRVVNMLNTAFPQIYAGTNVLETSLSNPNAMMHPAPTLLNTSLIESERDWLYYWDGITPSIGTFVEKMDQERLAVARAFGLDLQTIRKWYELAYNANGETLSDAVKNNPAYAEVKGQKTLLTRYVLEDIPTGLVPMIELGKLTGIETTRMETIVKLGELLTGKNFHKTGRTLPNLGLANMTVQEILWFIETGTRNSTNNTLPNGRS